MILLIDTTEKKNGKQIASALKNQFSQTEYEYIDAGELNIIPRLFYTIQKV